MHPVISLLITETICPAADVLPCWMLINLVLYGIPIMLTVGWELLSDLYVFCTYYSLVGMYVCARTIGLNAICPIFLFVPSFPVFFSRNTMMVYNMNMQNI